MSLAFSFCELNFLLSTYNNVEWILGHSFQNYVWKLQPHLNSTKGEKKNQMRPRGFTEVTEHMQPNASRIISTEKRQITISPKTANAAVGETTEVIFHARPRRKNISLL